MSSLILVLVGTVLVMIVVAIVLSALVFRRVGSAQLETCTPGDVPTSFGAGVADFVQLSFVVAGAIRVVNTGVPDAYVVLFVNPERQTYGRLWVTERGSTSSSIVSSLGGGKLATTTSAPTSADPTELQQVFPGASLADLCERHAEALDALTRRGVVVKPATSEEAEPLFREEWTRDVQTVQHAGVGLMAAFAARSVFRRPRFAGPLVDQRGADERIGRLVTH